MSGVEELERLAALHTSGSLASPVAIIVFCRILLNSSL